MSCPLISVVLPAYNAQEYIAESIKSILNQTLQNFELIILNDGSTDNTEKIVNSFSDPRIICLKNNENLGLIKTLNIGIKVARGKYLARMDADDICISTRFEQQVKFLEENADIAILGTNIGLVNDRGNFIGRGVQIPVTHENILWGFHRRTCIYHPTVMINLELVTDDLFYDEKFIHAEDFELWMRLIKKYKFANLNETLLNYRMHDESITAKYKEVSIESMSDALMTHSTLGLKKSSLKYVRFPGLIHDKEKFERVLCDWVNVYFSSIKKNNTYTEFIVMNYAFIIYFYSIKSLRPIAALKILQIFLKFQFKTYFLFGLNSVYNFFYRFLLPRLLR